jgi:hypothetical protein
MGQDNKFYAALSGSSIKRLNDSGNWEETNITSGHYYAFARGQGGKLYAAGYGGKDSIGIKRLE